MAALFLMTLFQFFGGMPQLAVTLENRSVWFKQRAVNMYTATAYSWAGGLVQVPISMLEVAIFLVIVYFMVGFSTGSVPSPVPAFACCACTCTCAPPG